MVLFSQAVLIGAHSLRIMSCIPQVIWEMTCTSWILLFFYHKLLLLMPIVSATYHNLRNINQSRHGITDLLISILRWLNKWNVVILFLAYNLPNVSQITFPLVVNFVNINVPYFQSILLDNVFPKPGDIIMETFAGQYLCHHTEDQFILSYLRMMQPPTGFSTTFAENLKL